MAVLAGGRLVRRITFVAVKRVSDAHAADAPYGLLALPKGCEVAVCPATRSVNKYYVPGQPGIFGAPGVNRIAQCIHRRCVGHADGSECCKPEEGVLLHDDLDEAAIRIVKRRPVAEL